jgi:hypothetical protein
MSERTRDIAARDHADGLAVIDHRQLVEPAAEEQRGRILERLLRRDRLDATEHRGRDRDARDRMLELRHRTLLLGT